MPEPSRPEPQPKLVDARVLESIRLRAEHTLRHVPEWMRPVRYGLERILDQAIQALKEAA